jgi:hypothetical protein
VRVAWMGAGWLTAKNGTALHALGEHKLQSWLPGGPGPQRSPDRQTAIPPDEAETSSSGREGFAGCSSYRRFPIEGKVTNPGSVFPGVGRAEQKSWGCHPILSGFPFSPPPLQEPLNDPMPVYTAIKLRLIPYWLGRFFHFAVPGFVTAAVAARLARLSHVEIAMAWMETTDITAVGFV